MAFIAYVDLAAARHACAGLVLSLPGRLRLVRGSSPPGHARAGQCAARIPAALDAAGAGTGNPDCRAALSRGRRW